MGGAVERRTWKGRDANMTIHKRLKKLEAGRRSGLVLFMADPFDTENAEPFLRFAHVDERILERAEGEIREHFVERANPLSLPFAILETSCKDL